MSQLSVAVVEDDPEMARIFDRILRKFELIPTIFHTGKDFILSPAYQAAHIVLLDDRLPDTTGTTLFKQLIKRPVPPLVIMMTGYPELESALELTRLGLFHYIKKPFDIAEVREILHSAFQILLSKEKDRSLDEFIGQHESIVQVKMKVNNIIRHSNAPCLILGETGTGKELMAGIIHHLTYQKYEHPPPMMIVDCTTLSKDLIEAELFGAERGAYTGAHARRIGLVEQARNGTIFLDEVGELSLELQAKFLRFLETGTYRRLGGNETLYSRGRVIAATHRDLKKSVDKGFFRSDLYFRLCYNVIHLPALRERILDIPSIAEKLLYDLCQKYKRPPLNISKSDLIQLQNHQWPGNVRQLKNVLENSLIHTSENARLLKLDFGVHDIDHPHSNLPSPQLSASGQTHPLTNQTTSGLPTLAEIEKSTIMERLKINHNNVSKTALQLGVNRQMLIRKMKKYGLKPINNFLD